jgi:CDP-2,3-bis-(O-geranylgeranyl)-sn-glycerol synthase
MQPLADLQLLILLTLANGTPVIAKRILGDRLAWPLDGGLSFADGRPLLGPSKTLRGILLAVLATTAGAALIGPGWRIGLIVGGLAMAGDLLSSFVKRRLNRPASSQAMGLDQVPEALLPLIACREALALSALDIAAVVAIFWVGEIVASRLLYRLGIRDRPY